MTVIYDMSPEVSVFLNRHQRFAVMNELESLSEASAFRLVYRLVEDVVNSLMLWLNDTHFFDDELEALFPWYCAGLRSDLAQLYYSEVIDPVWLRVTETISRIIPSKTYVMWNIARVQHSAILTSGADYRIVDWHARVMAGTIKPPTKKK